MTNRITSLLYKSCYLTGKKCFLYNDIFVHTSLQVIFYNVNFPHTFSVSTVLKSNVSNMKHSSNHFENICLLFLWKAHFVHGLLHSAIIRCVIKIWVFDSTLFQVLWDKKITLSSWLKKKWWNVFFIILHLTTTDSISDLPVHRYFQPAVQKICNRKLASMNVHVCTVNVQYLHFVLFKTSTGHVNWKADMILRITCVPSIPIQAKKLDKIKQFTEAGGVAKVVCILSLHLFWRK